MIVAIFTLIAIIAAFAFFVCGVVFSPTVIKHFADAKAEIKAKYEDDLSAVHNDMEQVKLNYLSMLSIAEKRAATAEADLHELAAKLEFWKTTLTPAQVAAMPVVTTPTAPTA